MPKIQSSIVLFVVFMAFVLAFGGYAALTFLRSRPEAPQGMITQRVNDVDVLLRFDPANTVQLLGPVNLGEEGRMGGEITAFTQEPLTQEAFTQEIFTLEAPVEATPEGAMAEALSPPETAVAPPTPTRSPEKVIFVPYQVQAGDSLYLLTQRFATSIALMAVHNISAASLQPGQIINLPVGNDAYCPGYRPYAVGEGDTAYSIARRFGTTVQELQAINNLDANFTVWVADVICVPAR